LTITPDGSLYDESEKYTCFGWHSLGIIGEGNEKCPQVGDDWTGKRGTLPAREYLEYTFRNNQNIKRLAILLDSVKYGFALDIDGPNASQIFQEKVLSRYSQQLQDKINKTTHTRTANNGYHWLFEIHRQDFPNGISQKKYWLDKENAHGEIKVIGTNQYLIERGKGYEAFAGRGIESTVTLSKEEVNEFLGILDEFERETKAISSVAGKLIKYYYKTNRQNLALRVAGYLHKHKVPEYLCHSLVEYLVHITGDEEPLKRFQAIRDTYSKDADSDRVSGRAKLLDAVDGDETVVVTIGQEFSRLGYSFTVNGNGDAREKNTTDPEQEEDNDTRNKVSAKVLKLIEPYVIELFKNQYETPFAAIMINGHRETLPILKSKRFEMWICKIMYELDEKTLGSESLKEVINNLAARAMFDGSTRTLDLRVSKDPNDDSVFYYDLTNQNWEVVKITRDGWSIEQSTDVPLMFRRFSNQQPQIYPAASKSYPPDIFDRFMDLINVKNNPSARLLLKCYIITLFIPEIPKAALMLHGPAGAAKSACQTLIKQTVDPSILISLAYPSSNDALQQQLSHNYVPYYDNVSIMKDWLSDALCRAITGSASSKRELYSDDDDILYRFVRCIGFNGINLAATKADLLDRGIIIELQRIQKKNVRDFNGDILPEFKELLPQLLAYIFDILVQVLKLESNGGIRLEAKSRMADFEIHAEMISRCIGNKVNAFVEAYEANKQLGSGEVLEGSPVAKAVIDLMESRDRWEGSTAELLSELESVAAKLKINTQKEKLWPKGTNVITRRINAIKTNLMDVGIQVSSRQHPTKRTAIIMIEKIPFEPFKPLENEKLCSKTEITKDISKDISADNEIPFGYTTQNRAQNQESNSMKDTKDIVSVSSEDTVSHEKTNNQGLGFQASSGNENTERSSSTKPYACQWCNISHNSTICFDTDDLLERHIVKCHPGWTAYPGEADIEKYKLEHIQSKPTAQDLV
jgi:hypothetical protein